MTLEEKISNILNDCDGSNWDSSGEYYEYFEKSKASELIAELIREEVGKSVNYGFDLACDKDRIWSNYVDEHEDLNGGQIFDILKEQYLNKLK